MAINEIIEVTNLIKLLKQLPEEKQTEFFYMIQGGIFMYANTSSAAIAEMERQRLDGYDRKTEYVGECQHCEHTITDDEIYYETHDCLFCSRECFEKYYGFKEV